MEARVDMIKESELHLCIYEHSLAVSQLHPRARRDDASSGGNVVIISNKLEGAD
jgi:hypothetical protein